MEVLLQWLDELDDLAFSVWLGADRWRKPALDVGSCATAALALVRIEAPARVVTLAVLGGIALASVVAWCIAAGAPRLKNRVPSLS